MNEFPIQKTELIAIGEKYFQIIAKGKILEIVKKSSKSSSNEEYIVILFRKYSFDGDSIDVIKVGRDTSCNISYKDDNSFSRIHCCFIFEGSEGLWKLINGDGKGKVSSNGTWIFASHSYEIQNNTVFKIDKSTIKISI